MHKYMKHELVSPGEESRCVTGFVSLIAPFCADVVQEAKGLNGDGCAGVLNLLGKYCMRMSLEKMRDTKAFNCGEMWLAKLKKGKKKRNKERKVGNERDETERRKECTFRAETTNSPGLVTIAFPAHSRRK